MYSILHALDHLYINLYRVFTNAEMDKYPSFTDQLSQNNVGEMTDDLRIEEDNGDRIQDGHFHHVIDHQQLVLLQRH